MRVGPITPLIACPDSHPIVVGRNDEAEGPEVRVEVLGADDDGQPNAFHIRIQQADESLLLFDHPHERVQRLERQSLTGFDEGRRAFDVDRTLDRADRKNVEGARCQLHRARQQRVVEQPLLVEGARSTASRAR